jgi:hypothetical protein
LVTRACAPDAISAMRLAAAIPAAGFTARRLRDPVMSFSRGFLEG